MSFFILIIVKFTSLSSGMLRIIKLLLKNYIGKIRKAIAKLGKGKWLRLKKLNITILFWLFQPKISLNASILSKSSVPFTSLSQKIFQIIAIIF